MKYQLTYWLRRHNTSYKLGPYPYLCTGFVRRILGREPAWIKLTLSPFPRRGYTKVRMTILGDAEVGGNTHNLFYALEKDIAEHMPRTFWFKLEEWK